ncbi:MAG: ABC transporter ATP-binding protein [Acidimicrobiia bacterium]
MSLPALEFTEVSKHFGPVRALAGMSLRVDTGSVAVLLGPNGAGKTTAVRVATGAMRPQSGTVRAFGLDPTVDGEEVRSRCGVVPARPALYERLTGHDNLRYAAELYEIGDDAPIRDAAARFGIVDALPLKVGGYSTGMRARLALARAVLHDPDLLLLDEPTAGLDPESARAVLNLIDEMGASGKTVLMCTHLLLEAEGLADQVIVADEGRSLVAGSPDELTRRFYPATTVTLDAEDRAELDRVADFDGVVSYERNGMANIQIESRERLAPLVAELVRAGIRLVRVEPTTPTLEQLYFTIRREIARGHRDEVLT